MSKKYLETIKAVDGKIYNLEYHQQRLNASLEIEDRYNLEKLLSPPLEGLYRCRVVYDLRTLSIEYIPYTKRQVNRLKLVFVDTLEYSKKYENRTELNSLFLLRESCDDILIVRDGFISDTSIANIAFYDGRVWFTPKSPLLFGTTRQRYINEARIIEKDIKAEEIKRYKKIALMNAMIDFDIIAKENIEDIIC